MSSGDPTVRGEGGAASLLVITMVGVLLLVSMALGVVAGMVHAHRVAQSAADLAALAGAGDAVGGGDGCARAAAVAAANGARLLRCRAGPDGVRLEVAVQGPRWRGHGYVLRARARAGPA